ncbi:MAG: GNAT family N-acetyltransferase [Nocardioidaceae bacterium]
MIEYAGAEVIAPLCEAASACWGERSVLHPGLVWWSASPHHGNVDDWRAAVWSDGAGTPVAAAWLEGRSTATVVAAHPHAQRPQLLVDAAAWARRHGDRSLSTDVLESDREVVAAWSRARLREADRPEFMVRQTHTLRGLPDPAPPPGHVVRPVGSSSVELDARVKLHVAAWTTSQHRSGFDEVSYAMLRRSPYYRPQLDVVVAGPDGRLLATALIWWDPGSGTGLVEPVGVRPDARGKGLARVAVIGALWALRAEGAQQAVVWPRGDAGYPGPRRLYEACGFVTQGRTVTMRR